MTENHGLEPSVIPEAIRQVLPRNVPIYLVGGAVRDALVKRSVEDLDFVLPRQALKTARSVANALKGDFFVLDDEREIGRVIIEKEQGGRQVLDFALQRSPDLEGDLLGRDFTINAIAIDLNNPGQLIDPLRGSRDLLEKKLRACSASSIKDDPVRILRAIRMANLFQLRIQPDTLIQIRLAVEQLSLVSAERIRDELYRIFETPGCVSSIRALDRLGVIQVLFPELEGLKHIPTKYDNQKTKWDHTLHVLSQLEILLSVLALQPDQETGNNLMMGLVSLKLGRFRMQLNTHLREDLSPGRTARQTLLLAAIFHLLGEDGLGKRGDADIKSRFQALSLSNQEIERLIKIISHFSLYQFFKGQETLADRRQIFRFFNYAGEGGIDAGLLFLAYRLVVGGFDLSAEKFTDYLSLVHALYEAWWEKYDSVVSPVLFVNGDDLMKTLNLEPGPLLGKILSEIKEAQAAGEVKSREEALALASRLV